MIAKMSRQHCSVTAPFNPAVLSVAARTSRAAPPGAPEPADVMDDVPAQALAPAAALPAGAACGWFESSWDLQQGLLVSEWPDSDGPVAELWFATLAAGRGVGSAGLQ